MSGAADDVAVPRPILRSEPLSYATASQISRNLDNSFRTTNLEVPYPHVKTVEDTSRRSIHG